ncbi:hypothetical protein KCH_66050 [Kitasatospora cheerisanensis KCTC 2395]|uniref:Uncharacterized protein n=1 Tax=Kitasatospora cheerisanensis KCTC 2395 TaxID=1348663 RepID=A0A066YJJ2_9ACTN|nr:hypothetical protein KCH_66050 [Kitasatospora cheerisanensis KCTC 2395]
MRRPARPARRRRAAPGVAEPAGDRERPAPRAVPAPARRRQRLAAPQSLTPVLTWFTRALTARQQP